MGTLRDLRRRKLVTQQEMAKDLGVRYQTVQAWEQGKAWPRNRHLRAMCEYFNIAPGDLLLIVEATMAEHEKSS